MTASIASYRNIYQYHFNSQQNNKARDEQRAEREQRQRLTLHSNKNILLDEIEVLLNELIAMRKAQQQKSARNEQLGDEYHKKALLLNVKWFALKSSDVMVSPANREMVQKLEQQRAQLLAQTQHDIINQQERGTGSRLSLTAAMKKAGLNQSPVTRADAALLANKVKLPTTLMTSAAPMCNETPQPLHATRQAATSLPSMSLQPSDSSLVDERPDVATLQQLANDVVLLADEMGELWQSVQDEALDAVISVLLQNPTAIKRNSIEPTATPQSAEQPELAFPAGGTTYDLERMLLNLRGLKISVSTLKIEIEKHGSDAMQAVMLETARKRLKDNAELQDKARQQQQSAERRGTIFKWLTRIVMTLVGLLVSALTAGAGAILFSLLFTLVEVVLEEVAGFSLTGKIAEGIGKGLAELMKLMGASGDWVEHVANALAQIIVLVASILVSKGISKFSTSKFGQRLAGFFTEKMPCLKKLPGVPDASKLAKPLQWVQKRSSLVQGGAGVVTQSLQLVQFGYLFQQVKTKRALGDSQAEIKQVEFWQDLLYQMMKNMPKGIEQSTKTAKEFVELISELVHDINQRNIKLTMNIAARH